MGYVDILLLHAPCKTSLQLYPVIRSTKLQLVSRRACALNLPQVLKVVPSFPHRLNTHLSSSHPVGQSDYPVPSWKSSQDLHPDGSYLCHQLDLCCIIIIIISCCCCTVWLQLQRQCCRHFNLYGPNPARACKSRSTVEPNDQP